MNDEILNSYKTTGGKIILEWILGEIGWKGVDCIRLAQNRDKWRALVDTGMNFGFYKSGELAEWLLAFQGLCSI
jgi:hypothetical protein